MNISEKYWRLPQYVFTEPESWIQKKTGGKLFFYAYVWTLKSDLTAHVD